MKFIDLVGFIIHNWRIRAFLIRVLKRVLTKLMNGSSYVLKCTPIVINMVSGDC